MMKNKILLPLLTCLFLMTACIPTITRVYLTPSISGTVIDVSTLKSVSDVAIEQRYENVSVASTLTDEEGKFNLPAYSEIQAKLLMVGHSLSNYQLDITFNETQYRHVYHATSVMIYEETFTDEIIWVDSDPLLIAPPPTPFYKTTPQWKKAIESEAFLRCNARLGYQAIQQLAIARKALTHGDPKLTSLAYHQVSFAWERYTNSCKNGEFFKPVLLTQIQAMDEEILSNITYYNNVDVRTDD